MNEIFNLHNLWILFVLIILESILGIDNLLYITIESNKVLPDYQKMVRRAGVTIALFLRIMLLYLIITTVQIFSKPLFHLNFDQYINASFTVHSIALLTGGIFVTYTALQEIISMLSQENFDNNIISNPRSVTATIVWICIINIIFSFDTVLSAMAFTKSFLLISCAIAISSILMLAIIDKVNDFLNSNKNFEVLGLFILLIVGILLLSDGGELAQLKIFNHKIEAMTKSTFYFIIGILITIDIVQTIYTKSFSKKKPKS